MLDYFSYLKMYLFFLQKAVFVPGNGKLPGIAESLTSGGFLDDTPAVDEHPHVPEFGCRHAEQFQGIGVTTDGG